MLSHIGNALLKRWYRSLRLPLHAPSFYLDRYNEELEELSQAKTSIDRLSETSDVLFAWKRAQFEGYPVGDLPPALLRASDKVHVYVYMVLKLTSRWMFFRTTALLCGARLREVGAMSEVVNAGKDWKLERVARTHGIDPVRFRRVGGKLRRVWLLLP